MADTIFALATARGKAGVAVIRVSGPKALEAASALGVQGLTPRRASLRDLVFEGDAIDSGIVIYFEPGRSFTGEKVVEFQIHGGESVVSALLWSLERVPGLRLAEAGEFTRRALENGMMDLTQVEALADLIDSETEAQRRQAQAVLKGAIGQKAAAWRKDLIRAAALIEASLDFSEEDVPENVVPEVLALVSGLRDAFRLELTKSEGTERVRAGFEVAIIGAPNAGKSSLLNALVGREAAITSSIAGTTRDIIEVRMEIEGLAVTLLDTAGLRETEDEIEKIGVDRAKQRAEAADLRVLVLAPEDLTDVPYWTEQDIVVRSKADLVPQEGAISAKTGQGLDDLVKTIGLRLKDRVSGSGILIRERHRAALKTAFESMESARSSLYGEAPPLELVAADIRMAAHALDLLVGKIGVETLLDEIFSSFCIGK
ncbi:tRNA uridine-5-carboxymethylaminomethyl(34) synthesis GTPase MnmE [Pseudorhodobacter sp. MZDSW-24AT]|uniref:tRNA uridine-5-carboxymethylaminomethyl(34) synthesis GTPase MnmE n=1 Tax=Pseudorhodobacter sp. MZDSW-24AT TaxID=2052957 RepID=UPI000C1F4540|nr:tRNA uridine-5-carboxymethylaminomethyl(34) synthesis GTPase MnmE [Pseudorhodobacter sp. MZDSW-24AT]PJF09984.1 tRNA uridine-5-carboxymethylaminomethyl(34) synthesis GTPase MnmE [Pseudorhodobacter sp. MZDSW-24AT]